MPTQILIDLYSDTMTKPTAEMRRFMCDAEVGDEQKGEDPTVNLLQDMVAELLGPEPAPMRFVPNPRKGGAAFLPHGSESLVPRLLDQLLAPDVSVKNARSFRAS